MAQLLQPKQQLAGYEIGELVGKGGMGEVYRAIQISMDRVVALKILAPRLAKQDPIFAKRFVDEARAAGRLNHPNIIAVHDVGKAPMPGGVSGEPDLDYFSMEYVDGESVKDVIERQDLCPLSLVGQVMLGMSEALVYAEAQGIVHRDIKPDNIMITNGGVVKLADLGLALQLGGEEIIGEKDEQGRGKVMGTPLYMSPEQARALPVDSRSDQYSLGATLFHMLTGKPPFKGENAKVIMRAHVFDPVPDPKDLNHDVPEAWRQLSMRLMAKTPDERFPNAVAMRAAVQAAISGHASPGISRRVRTNGWANAHGRASAMPSWARYVVYAFAGAVVVMVVIFAVPWGGRTQKPPNKEVVEPPPPDPQVIAAKQVERVRQAISALPADHQSAIAALAQLAEDKSIPLGPARDLIERESSSRKTQLAEQQRKAEQRLAAEQAQQRQARSIELEQAWAANDLVRVKACLDFLTGEADKLTPAMRERLAVVKGKFGVALVDLQKHYIDQMVLVRNADELKAILAKATASPLPPEAVTSISEFASKRSAELGQVANAPPADDRPLWQAFGAQLDELRGGFNYGEITRLAEQEAPKFPTSTAREMVQSIGLLGRLATKAEAPLRYYIASANPEVTVVIAGKAIKVKLRILDKNVGYLLQEGSGDAQLTQDRRMFPLPLRQLMEKALADDSIPAADRPAMLAAMLWVWRVPDAAAAFAVMPDSPLTKAVMELERKTRVLDLRAKLVRTGDQAMVSYDLGKNPWYIEDFIGEGISVGTTGLAWTTATKVNPKGKESDIPTVRWKQGLLPPFTVTSQFTMPGKAHLLLFGVASGDHRVRIGYNNTRSSHSCVTLVTKPDGQGFTIPPSISATGLVFKPDVVQKVEIKVDLDRRVSLRYNDQLLTDALKLPDGGAITPLIQAVQLEDGQTTSVHINAMTISGMLPAATTPAE
jgi:serine/threonine protein kinase